MRDVDLREFARDEFSQGGEDGILEKLFELLGVSVGWCVEFGAWDGIHLSNTHNLLRNMGWCGLLIEADAAKFAELTTNMGQYPRLTCLHRHVGFDPPDDLETILDGTDVPTDFDLLSIDVDGNDYHVWEDVSRYSPKVVVIEYNPTIPNHVKFVQPRDWRLNQGNSLLSLTELGHRKGYQLAAATTTNGIFVRHDLFPAVGVADNSLDVLRPGRPHETTLFQLFDGTLVLQGCTRLLWHDIDMRAEKMQVLPKPLRRYPGAAGPRVGSLQRVWRRVYRWWP